MSTLLLFILAVVLAGALTFVVAGRDTPNAVALPIASGALTPVTALSMTALMRMVGAVLGVGTVQFFAADFVALVPAGNTGLSITIVGLAVTLAWAYLPGFAVPLFRLSMPDASITGGAIALSCWDSSLD